MKKETFDTILYTIGLIAFIAGLFGLVELDKKREINDKDTTQGGTM